MKYRFAFILNLLLTASFAVQIFAQNGVAVKATPNNSRESAAPASTVSGEKIEQDVAEAVSVIEDNYVASGKKLDYNELFKSSIDSMLHTLDPHSNYFDAKEFEQFRTDQSSRYYGIGATIGDLQDANGKLNGTFIRATFEGAPANRAGLRYGDKILEVNGTSMAGKPFQEVRTFLIGPRGTTAKITVEHSGTGRRDTYEIIRDAVAQPSIPDAYMIRPGIGYIRMSGGFNQTTYNEFRTALSGLKSQGMQNLIVDLRGNGGGLVNQSYQVANTFLSSGQLVFTQKGRLGGTSDPFLAENPNPDKTPLVLLVNGGTASASEILAGALQDHDRALIVGESTFGKGLVQNPFLIDYGSMLLLTIAKYETPSGRLIQRDYSKGELYDYYTKGGTLSRDAKPANPTGAQSRTDTGRVVYGGGGITPDEIVKPETVSPERFNLQRKFAGSAIFGFALDLANGKVAGFENYKVDQPIQFDHDLTATDFPVTENLFQAFKNYAVSKYKYAPAQIDRERDYIEHWLRTELVTAAYGSTTSEQIFNISQQVFSDNDPQLKKAVEVLPRAKQLAQDSARVNAQRANTEINR